MCAFFIVVMNYASSSVIGRKNGRGRSQQAVQGTASRIATRPEKCVRQRS